jgi:hypothetical protein
LGGVALLRGAARTAWLERVTPLAIADIEMIPDHREHHRVRAVQKLTVFGRLEVHLGQDVRGTMAVPAMLVSNFGLQGPRTGHAMEYTASWIGGKDKSALELSL